MSQTKGFGIVFLSKVFINSLLGITVLAVLCSTCTAIYRLATRFEDAMLCDEGARTLYPEILDHNLIDGSCYVKVSEIMWLDLDTYVKYQSF